jgi:anti-anti-sigma factor
VIGERIVSAVPSLAHLAAAVRAEHERWDGNGYPDGLAGREIPVASRICLACDAYHAMVSDRPYRRALGEEIAREELERHAGTQFCPATVRALLDVVARRPAGRHERTPAVLRGFSVDAEQIGGNGEVVAVGGELDLITISQLEAVLSESFDRSDWVVVDLAQTSYIDSSALRLLSNASRAFERSGVAFAIARPSGTAQRTLDMSAATHGLTVEKTRTAAIRRLRERRVRV